MLLFLSCSAPLQRRFKAVVFHFQTSALWTVILLPAWGILVRPKLHFRLSGRQYSLAMAEPSGVDQKSDNCTFILKLHPRYLSSPAKEPFPGLGAVQVLHSKELKPSTAEVVSVLCVHPFLTQCGALGQTKLHPAGLQEKSPHWVLDRSSFNN